eukprot:gi/632958122/ref/XP_007894855.1/ PREDICTED: dnaJ homolog subfamily C member 30 [Callorhinchus milii]
MALAAVVGRAVRSPRAREVLASAASRPGDAERLPQSGSSGPSRPGAAPPPGLSPTAMAPLALAGSCVPRPRVMALTGQSRCPPQPSGPLLASDRAEVKSAHVGSPEPPLDGAIPMPGSTVCAHHTDTHGRHGLTCQRQRGRRPGTSARASVGSVHSGVTSRGPAVGNFLLKAPPQPKAFGCFKGTRRCFTSNNSVPLHRSKTAYYDLLQISPTATRSQIKTAYYKQSFIFHPDKNAGSEQAVLKFTQISEAYSVLSNGILRRKYDRGILTLVDLQMEKSPSDKTLIRKQHQTKITPKQFQSGKPMFNFDEFYRAHYSEQLEKERILRLRKAQYRKEKEDLAERLRLNKIVEVSMAMLLFAGMALLLNFRSNK